MNRVRLRAPLPLAVHSLVLDKSQSAPTTIRPYEIILRSGDLWLTDSAACGQVNFLKWLQRLLKYWWRVKGISRVNIFSPSLVISISPRPLPPPTPLPCHPLDATLMHVFCSIEHIGMADFPRLSGALDQILMLPSFSVHHCWEREDERGGENKQSPGRLLD